MQQDFGPRDPIPQFLASEEEERPRRRLRGPFLVILVMVASAGGVWIAYTRGHNATPGEVPLIQLAAEFPRIVETSAMAHEPHRIAFYLGDLAAAFHAHWNSGNDDSSRRFIDAARPDVTGARLALARAIGQVIHNGLAIMGVAAVEEMQ